MQGILSVLTKGCPDMEHASSCFSKALASISQASWGGAAADAGETSAATVGSDAPGFDESVNRNLVIPCPPRALKVRDSTGAGLGGPRISKHAHG